MILKELTAIRARPDGSNIFRMDDPDLLNFPIAYLSEPGYWYPSDSEAAGLRTYLAKGGFLIVDDYGFPNCRQAIDDYRAEHGIEGTWQARERVVVALTGGAEGETLLRRGARIAARSAGGELLAVHVSAQDGLRQGSAAAA